MPEYYRNEAGLLIRVYEHRMRQSPRWPSRAPGEVDRGSNKYRIEVLRKAIRKLNFQRDYYDMGGW